MATRLSLETTTLRRSRDGSIGSAAPRRDPGQMLVLEQGQLAPALRLAGAQALGAVIADEAPTRLGHRLADRHRGLSAHRSQVHGLDPARRREALAELAQGHEGGHRSAARPIDARARRPRTQAHRHRPGRSTTTVLPP